MQAYAWSIDGNHDVRGFHDDRHMALGLDVEFVDRLIGDRGGDNLAAADVDADMRGGGAFLDIDHDALDLVACTDAHDDFPWFRRRICDGVLPVVDGEKWDRHPDAGAPALTARRPKTLTHFGLPAIASPAQILLLGIWRGQHLAAFSRQLRQCQSRFWRGWLDRRLWMKHLVLEPVGKVGRLTAFILGLRLLALAFRAAGRAKHPDMEMVVVAPPRPDLGQPTAVALGYAAQRLLDCRIDEDALNAGFLCGVPDNQHVTRREHVWIDVEPVVAHHHHRGGLLALFARQSAVRHRRQPDVGIEADLMAGMAGERRSAARLADVANEDAGPAGILVGLCRKALEQRDHV